MQIDIIKKDKKNIIKDIEPNVIHNRFDLLFGDDFDLYLLQDQNFAFYIPVHLEAHTLKVGMYLRKIDVEKWQQFVDFLFKQYSQAQNIWVLYTYTPLQGIEALPHWHIDLPDTIEEFDAALHANTRYNTKRYPKKVKQDIGEYTIEKVPASKISEQIVVQYLKWKKETHEYIWPKSPLLYIKEAGITEAYIMNCNSELLAIGFICTTGNNVYFENFSYNRKYSKYNLGNILFYYMVQDLIKNKKKKFYLLGGDYNYKKCYNGIKNLTYTGHIHRHPKIVYFIEEFANKINQMPLPYKLRKFMAKFIGLFFFNRFYAHMLKGKIKK